MKIFSMPTNNIYSIEAGNGMSIVNEIVSK